MEKLYLFLIILLYRINSQLINNTNLLVQSKNFYILYEIGDYYCLIAKNRNYTIEKEYELSNYIDDNVDEEENCIFIADYFLSCSNKYYIITYNSPCSYREIEIGLNIEQMIHQMVMVGSTKKFDDDIIIFGYINSKIYFLINFKDYTELDINNKIKGLSCKHFGESNFICITIIESKSVILYLINPYEPIQNKIFYNEYESICSFGFYDTDKNNIKLLCIQNIQNIKCNFLNITKSEKNFTYGIIGDENIVFITKNVFTEKNCYFSPYLKNYLFCCGITGFIKCHLINRTNYYQLRIRNIEKSGDNFYLAIKIINNYANIFFINNKHNIYKYHLSGNIIYSSLSKLELKLSFNSDKLLINFKNQIRNNITSYVNSSKVINGTHFFAMVLSSDKLEYKEQFIKIISSFDLGNCINVIKEFYNITKEENLIIVNIQLKNDDIQDICNIDKSFYPRKDILLEIYDYSNRKLDLSVCKEYIKIMKYIGDTDKIDLNSAKIFSDQGIDVFNPADDFFNDICYPYDNSNKKDIIINDRRNDIYQNVSFCQDDCRYDGINYRKNQINNTSHYLVSGI